MTLTATPAPGKTFAGWTGACSGTGPGSVPIKAVTSELPTTSACPGWPPGFACSGPPTGDLNVTAAFQ